MSERDDVQGSDGSGGVDASEDTRTMYDPVPSGALASIPAEGWYVVLDNDQQGPMSRGTLLERLGDRSDAADSWVWREGYADWRRAGEIEGLSELIAFNEAETAAVVEANPTGATPEDDSEERTRVMSSEQQQAAHTEAAERREDEAVSAEESLDSLFGDESAAATEGGEFFDVPESASVDEAMLYQRQDTSVLFTLDDFDRSDDSARSDSIGIGDGLGERTPESGLIDIRAIARNRVEADDGSARGERLFGGEESPRAATQWRRPVTTRLPAGQQPLLRRRGPSRFWQSAAIAMGVALAAVIVVGGWMLLQDDAESPSPVAVAPPELPPEAPEESAPIAPEQPEVAEAPAEAAPEVPKDEEAPTDTGSAELAASDEASAGEDEAAPEGTDAVKPPAPTLDTNAAKPEAPAKPAVKKKPRTPEQIAAAKAAAERRAEKRAQKKAERAAAKAAARAEREEKKAAQAAAKAAKAPKKSKQGSKASSKGADATALLNSLGASGGGGSKKPVATNSGGGASGPAKLSSSVIRRTIRKVHSKVLACHRNHGGTGSGVKVVKAKLVVRGSGSVATASVGSPFTGTAAGSCMIGVLKGVQFPSFAAESQTVRIPFRL